MSQYLIQGATLKGIADSIRSRTGGTEPIAVVDMATAIAEITVGETYTVLEDVPVSLDMSNGDQLVKVPDGYVAKSAIIQKPETLIPENIAKDIDIAGVIGTHEGGGIPEGYVTVTFRYTDQAGDSKEFSRLVMVGDDCPDPVTQGRIDTPTMENTAQYDYTHNGWSDTNGGSADGDALKNITEDKVLYSAFASTVRYYIVTYYDDDGVTVLNTEQVPYGSMPSYEPTKDGYVLDGWTPNTPVTGDMTYTAVWKEKKALANYTWAELDAMSVEEVRANFKVGDTRQIKTSGCTTLESLITVTLIGIEHDDLADGSGKAKMSFCVNPMPYIYSSGGVTIYRAIPPDKNKGYIDQESRPNSSCFISARWDADATSEVNPYVKTVKKKCYKFYDGTLWSSLIECDDTYFWLSLAEIGYKTYTDGEKYEYFTEKASNAVTADEAIFDSAAYQYTRTQESSSRFYSVKKGSKPYGDSSRCTYLGGFCI